MDIVHIEETPARRRTVVGAALAMRLLGIMDKDLFEYIWELAEYPIFQEGEATFYSLSNVASLGEHLTAYCTIADPARKKDLVESGEEEWTPPPAIPLMN